MHLIRYFSIPVKETRTECKYCLHYKVRAECASNSWHRELNLCIKSGRIMQERKLEKGTRYFKTRLVRVCSQSSYPRAYNMGKACRSLGQRCPSTGGRSCSSSPAPGKRGPLGCWGPGHPLFGCFCFQADRRHLTFLTLEMLLMKGFKVYCPGARWCRLYRY